MSEVLSQHPAKGIKQTQRTYLSISTHRRELEHKLNSQVASQDTQMVSIPKYNVQAIHNRDETVVRFSIADCIEVESAHKQNGQEICWFPILEELSTINDYRGVDKFVRVGGLDVVVCICKYSPLKIQWTDWGGFINSMFKHLFCCYVRLLFFTSVSTSATLELQEQSVSQASCHLFHHH